MDNKELFEVLDWMKDCLNDLYETIEVLEQKHGYLIDDTSFDFMNEVMEKLGAKLGIEGYTHD